MSDIKTPSEYIREITIYPANLEHIARTGKINANLSLSIEAAMKAYALEFSSKLAAEHGYKVIALESEINDLKTTIGRMEKGELRLEAVKKRLLNIFEKYRREHGTFITSVLAISTIEAEIRIKPRHIK